jgi:hypothetical protein
MPGVTPLRPDDVGQARAWAAFVADDARATASPSLEARVLLAAQAAMTNRPRVDEDRRRRRWLAGASAVAASLLAAAAWYLSPSAPPHDAPRAAGTPPAAIPMRPATAPSHDATAPIDLADAPGRPLPMTNVEAGRLLATPPQRLLAARPLFESTGGGPVRIAALPRGRSFNAPTVEPAVARTLAGPAPPVGAPPSVIATAPLTPVGPPVAATPPEVWSTRGFRRVFDPAAADTPDKPAPAPVRLDQVAPRPTKDDPPAPPK